MHRLLGPEKLYVHEPLKLSVLIQLNKKNRNHKFGLLPKHPIGFVLEYVYFPLQKLEFWTKMPLNRF